MRPNTVKPKTYAPIATYEQIENDMRARISSGDWTVGSLIPSRRELAKRYNVDLRTLQRAIAALLEDGTLRAEGTRGTSVARSVRPETSSGGVLFSASVGQESRLDSSRAVVTAYVPPYHQSPATATVGLIGISQSASSDLINFNHFSVLPVLQNLERVLAKSGSTTLFFERFRTDQPLILVEEAVASLLEERVDALVVIDLHDDSELAAAVMALLPELPVPLIYVSGGTILYRCLHVYHENRTGGYIAAQHLLQQGLKRLIFFATFAGKWADERYEGAQAAVTQAGLSPETLRRCPSLPAVPADSQENLAYAISCSLLREGWLEPAETPVGIIAANDFAAYGFIRAAAEVGLAPGSDFAILGFDDAPPSRSLGLTSLRRPLEAMGEEAAYLIQRVLADRTLDIEVGLRMHLVPRASTRMQLLRLP